MTTNGIIHLSLTEEEVRSVLSHEEHILHKKIKTLLEEKVKRWILDDMESAYMGGSFEIEEGDIAPVGMVIEKESNLREIMMEVRLKKRGCWTPLAFFREGYIQRGAVPFMNIRREGFCIHVQFNPYK